MLKPHIIIPYWLKSHYLKFFIMVINSLKYLYKNLLRIDESTNVKLLRNCEKFSECFEPNITI